MKVLLQDGSLEISLLKNGESVKLTASNKPKNYQFESWLSKSEAIMLAKLLKLYATVVEG